MIFNSFFQNTGLEFMWPSFESLLSRLLGNIIQLILLITIIIMIIITVYSQMKSEKEIKEVSITQLVD